MNVCGFPILNDNNQAIANCNDKPGHEGACNWLLSRDQGQQTADGIESLLREHETEADRMRCALLSILEHGDYLGIRYKTGEAWIMDIARLGLGLPPRDPDAKLP